MLFVLKKISLKKFLQSTNPDFLKSECCFWMPNQCILFSICVGTSTTTRNWELGFLKRNVDQGFFHHLPNVWHTMSHPLVNAVSESADSGYAVIWGCPKWFSVCVLTWFWPRFQNFLGIFVKIYNIHWGFVEVH